MAQTLGIDGAATGNSTPPHHPNHGVHMSVADIESLLQRTFSGSELLRVNSLESGKSFNNRIYFLRARLGPLGDAQYRTEELVLKINGRPFGAAKVINEVSCLWILEKTCPDVPSPRVFAWSEDGTTTVSIDRCSGLPKVSHNGQRTGRGAGPGWILMSKAQGEALALTNLESEEMVCIGSQLADIVARWRNSIPAQRYCGAVMFSEEQDPELTHMPMSPDPMRPWFKVTGIVGDAITFDVPITNHRDYLKIKVEDKLRQLETTDIYLPNRYLSPLLTDFLSNTLPTLKLANGVAEFVFTHFDLSPRNVLVSGTPPRVTGLVDFEFSGFFPKVDEFVNDYVDNGGDWPSAAYSAYLGRLAELGVETPAHGIDEAVWKQAYWFGQMVEHIAPWWLPGDEGEEGLRVALQEAASVVEEMLKNLEKLER